MNPGAARATGSHTDLSTLSLNYHIQLQRMNGKDITTDISRRERENGSPCSKSTLHSKPHGISVGKGTMVTSSVGSKVVCV